jgi:hypothetical protein
MLDDYTQFVRCANCGEKVPKPKKSCHVFCPECGEELTSDLEDNDMLDEYDDEAEFSYDRDDDGYNPRRHREQEDWE